MVRAVVMVSVLCRAVLQETVGVGVTGLTTEPVSRETALAMRSTSIATGVEQRTWQDDAGTECRVKGSLYIFNSALCICMKLTMQARNVR